MEIRNWLSEFRNISELRSRSNDVLEHLRGSLSGVHGPNVAVVTTGSYARREASSESDIDYFVIYKDIPEQEAEKLSPVIKEKIAKLVNRMPSATGAFGASHTVEEICSNIGGNADNNVNITRRMLFLLEAEYLSNEELFQTVRGELIDRYIRDSITEHQVTRFMLNDLIRYYRTICVDFEFKTQEMGKEWGTRNIKLVFSRKLIYFSGILVVADSYQRTYLEKKERALRLFSMPPLDRIVEICGPNVYRALRHYDGFLGSMSNGATRKELDGVKEDRKTHTENFKRIKNEAQHFSLALLGALNQTYPSAHPIHLALVL